FTTKWGVVVLRDPLTTDSLEKFSCPTQPLTLLKTGVGEQHRLEVRRSGGVVVDPLLIGDQRERSLGLARTHRAKKSVLDPDQRFAMPSRVGLCHTPGSLAAPGQDDIHLVR